MAFILPDKVLDTLVCDTCSKYLSVKPIIVYPNRRIKCGRCVRSKKQSGGVISLYGVIAENCLFKCVNRFDGCRELLTYSQVRDHEKVCLGKIYKCPICLDCSEIHTFLLLKHFRDHHKEAILDCPVMVLNLDQQSETSSTYLYQLNDDLFFVHLSSSKLEEMIRVHISYLGDSKRAKTITQQFTVTSENKNFNYKSKINPCTAYSIENGGSYCIKIENAGNIIFMKFEIVLKNLQLMPVPLTVESDNSNGENSVASSSILDAISFSPMVRAVTPRKISLNSTFQRTFPRIALSKCNFAIIESNILYFLHCFNCQEICWRGLSRDVLVLKFYFSIKFRHSICYYCFQMLKQEKKVFENDYMVSNFHKDFHKRIEFYCRWNCGKTFTADYHLGHEESCELQPLRPCPESNCLFRGTLVEIAVHMRIHPGKEISTYSNFYISCLFDRNIYVFIQNEFVYLKIVSNQGLNISIDLNNHDNKNKSKIKPVVLLFDENKYFLMKFQNSITKNEANHWLKIILAD